MPTNFPAGLDALTSENDLNDADDLMDGSTGAPGVKHSKVHGDANDAIGALEAKVGVDGSAVTTSLDYLAHHPARAVISDQLLAGTATTVSFLNVPQTYRNLVLEMTGRGDVAALVLGVRVRFNTDQTANYLTERVQGAGAAATASQSGVFSGIDANLVGGNVAATHAGIVKMWIPNYTNALFRKAVSFTEFRFDGTTTITTNCGGQWGTSGSAINQIDCFASSGNFIIGSRFTLIGEL